MNGPVPWARAAAGDPQPEALAGFPPRLPPTPVVRRDRDVRAALRWLRLASLVLPVFALLAFAAWSWQAHWAAAEVDARRSAEMIREYALRLVQTQDVVLDGLNALADAAGEDEAALRALQPRLATMQSRFDFVLRLGIVDRAGMLIVSSRNVALREDVNDRAYVRAAREGVRLSLDRAILRPNGEDALVVSKPRTGPGFRGVVVSTLGLETLSAFFSRLASDRLSAATLVRADGMVLARQDTASPPAVLPPQSPAMRAFAGGADRGTYRAVSTSDGVPRLYAFSRVEGLPLFAAFGVARTTVVQGWLAGLGIAAAGLFLVGALGAAAASWTLRGLGAEEVRQRGAHDRALLEEARRSVAFRESLLQELHHRVKNSLMTVLSLIRLRGRSGSDPGQVLREVELRVLALAQVHDLLHVSELLSRLDLGLFLRTLAAHPAVVPPERGIGVRLEADCVEVPVEKAVPAAMVVLELLTNALKHAFPPDRPGTIDLTLRQEGAEVVLGVRDDGVGLPEVLPTRRSSGLSLVQRFAAQLGGRMEVLREGGTEVRVRFPA